MRFDVTVAVAIGVPVLILAVIVLWRERRKDRTTEDWDSLEPAPDGSRVLVYPGPDEEGTT